MGVLWRFAEINKTKKQGQVERVHGGTNSYNTNADRLSATPKMFSAIGGPMKEKSMLSQEINFQVEFYSAIKDKLVAIKYSRQRGQHEQCPVRT